MWANLLKFFKTAANKFGEFFQEGNGMMSAMRLVFIVWGVGIFLECFILSIMHKQFISPDARTFTFLGSLTAGKLVQNYTENTTTTSTTIAVGPQAPAAPVATTPPSVQQ